MSSILRLHKLEGLGNDFLVAFVDELPDADEAAAAALRWCDRTEGVGADGLIFATVDFGWGDAESTAAMRLWNSDGSQAEVSGNGLRCLTHAIALKRRIKDLEITINTVAGPRRCVVTSPWGNAVLTGTVEMGEIRPGPEPDRADMTPADVLVGIVDLGSEPRWATVDVGNPHVVFEVAEPDEVPVDVAGPAVEALFSGGINVHFGKATSRGELRLAVWERGAGATAACGTGAVASAAAFHQWGKVDERVTVNMEGGSGVVDLTGPVTLTGESEYVKTADVADV